MLYPSPILFNLGPVALHWYGFLISLSVILGYFIGQKLFHRYRLPGQLFLDLVFYLVIFGLLGGRLWHVATELSYYWAHPLNILKIWQGGLAIHGALLAGIIVVWFFVIKLSKQTPDNFNNLTIKQFNTSSSSRPATFLLLLDIFAPLLVLGQAIGRWGNYFNQELYGRPTDLPWGIPIDLAHRLPGWENFSHFHPIFLYESLWCLLIFLVLIFLHRHRLSNSYKPTTLQPYQPGFIFFSYLILYSLGRFLIGFLRLDPQVGLLGLRLDQWVSVVLILVGVIYSLQQKNCHPRATPH